MSDRPITRVTAGVIGPNQPTIRDGRPPEMPAPHLLHRPPVFARGPAPDQNTLVDGVPPSLVQQTAQALYGASTPRDARLIAPHQITMVDGIPAAIVHESPALRIPPMQSRTLPPAPRTTSRRPSVWVTRQRAIVVAVLASTASALLAGGIVHALHERQQRNTTPALPPTAPSDAVLHPRP